MQQPLICPSCHAPNLAQARFCQQCGYDIILNNSGPRFFLTRVIKEGGQGAVFEGIDEAGKVVAVKEMLDRFTDPQERTEAVKRFQAEAKTLRELSHPRIPQIYASFNDEGRHYLVMEFIQGEDLDDLVTREGPLPEAKVLAWADELCDVLGYLHDKGVIYRDMKPSNAMIERATGRIKMIDFGIAKVFQPTQRGTQIGTPGYAPPEQYQGLATHVSDIYALGATLHHLLSGRDPRDHPPFNFPRLSGVSSRTADAIARALQMREEDRFQSIEELRSALRPPPARAPAPAPLPTPARPAPPLSPPTPTPASPPTAGTSRTAVLPPVAPAPLGSAASTSAAPVAAGQAGKAPAASPARRRSCLPWVLTLLLLVLLLGGAAYFLLPQLGLVGPQPPTASATPQVLVAKPFRVSDLQIVIPPGTSSTAVNDAYALALLQVAGIECSCTPQLQPGSLVYLYGGEPQVIETTADGVRYQASLEATILVPE